MIYERYYSIEDRVSSGSDYIESSDSVIEIKIALEEEESDLFTWEEGNKVTPTRHVPGWRMGAPRATDWADLIIEP